jgi:hypothetical protein
MSAAAPVQLVVAVMCVMAAACLIALIVWVLKRDERRYHAEEAARDAETEAIFEQMRAERMTIHHEPPTWWLEDNPAGDAPLRAPAGATVPGGPAPTHAGDRAGPASSSPPSPGADGSPHAAVRAPGPAPKPWQTRCHDPGHGHAPALWGDSLPGVKLDYDPAPPLEEVFARMEAS